MNIAKFTVATAIALCLVSPALAAGDTPIASKDGVTFTLDDVNVYWLRNLGKDMLLDFFQMMIVYQEGQKQGLQPTDSDKQKFIADEMGQAIYNEFMELYDQQTVDQLIEYTIVGGKYEEWLRDKIRRDNNIAVTEQDAHQYYMSNLDQFHLPDGVHISLISVDNQTQADAVIQSLAAGRNFNDLAAEVNMDATMRANKGEIGVYRKGEGLPQPLEDAAFALQEGQYSEVIKGQNYHIIYCHRKYPAISHEFADIKDQLMLDLVEAQIDPYYFDAIAELMERELPRFNIEAKLFKPEADTGSAPATP